LIRLLLLIAALLWPALAHAAKPPPAPEVPAMWEVTDGKSRALLFGTVHSLPRGVDWFRPHVAKGLDGSQRLVMETEIPDSPGAMMPVVMRLARLQAPRPLMERVPESWQPTLQRALDRLKPGPLDWYDTWYVALTLGNLQAQANGLDPRIGVEAVLAERARMRNLPIQALETAEQQLIYFDALTEADQQQMLLGTLEDLDGSKAEMDALVADWMAGRTDALAMRVNDEFERSPMLRRMLVEDRNARWAEWIATEIGKAPAPMFVAVGAGHLAGPGSLIAELEKRGLKVKPVVPAPPAKKRRR
jgi:uncharacterized protein YbaP (TraB family)